ncbi:MAG: hypothetical protein WC966_02785 [Bradymonadales bacterium]
MIFCFSLALSCDRVLEHIIKDKASETELEAAVDGNDAVAVVDGDDAAADAADGDDAEAALAFKEEAVVVDDPRCRKGARFQDGDCYCGEMALSADLEHN